MKKVKVIFTMIVFIAGMFNAIFAKMFCEPIFGAIYDWLYEKTNNIAVAAITSIVICLIIFLPIRIVIGTLEGKIIGKLINRFAKA